MPLNFQYIRFQLILRRSLKTFEKNDASYFPRVNEISARQYRNVAAETGRRRNWPDGVIEEERIVAIGWTPPTARRCLKLGPDE